MARWWAAPASTSRASPTSSAAAGTLRYNCGFQVSRARNGRAVGSKKKQRKMLYYLISTIYVLSCLLLLMVVLLQQGKGGDLASAFGGGSSQTAFGARAGATV